MDIRNMTVFEQNTVMNIGGALLFQSFGQLRVFPQTNLVFDRNNGRYRISCKIDFMPVCIL